jgi:hypothetical protein
MTFMKITENQGHRCGSSACRKGLASLRSARLFMRFALIKREGGSESLYPLLFVFERTFFKFKSEIRYLCPWFIRVHPVVEWFVSLKISSLPRTSLRITLHDCVTFLTKKAKGKNKVHTPSHKPSEKRWPRSFCSLS